MRFNKYPSFNKSATVIVQYAEKLVILLPHVQNYMVVEGKTCDLVDLEVSDIPATLTMNEILGMDLPPMWLESS